MSDIFDSAGEGHTRKSFVWATALGNGLVTYDFTVYSFFAVLIGKLFFPADSSFASLLLSLATFGVGFVMRPIGAVVIGNLADRKGRKIGMTISNSMMLIGTSIIVFVPTYASIGVAATVLIVLARLMQGFATGGESGLASVVLMELADKKRRCFVVSWRSVGQAAAALAGALISTAMTALLTPEEMQQWGWRVPFAIGLLIGPVGFFIRRNMVHLPMSKLHRPNLRDLIAQRRQALLFGILSMAAPSVGIYLLVYYMPQYLVRTLHMPATISLFSASLSSAAIILFLPLLAVVTDRRVSRKSIQYVTMIASALLAYPCFFILEHGVGEIASLAIIAAYSALLLSNNAATTVMMLEAFPLHQRATGVSIIYSFGVTLFGAFSPLIVTWLIKATANPVAPGWYLLVAICISLFALVRFPPSVKEC